MKLCNLNEHLFSPTGNPDPLPGGTKMQHRLTQHPILPTANKSKLASMNPYSRGSLLLGMALKRQFCCDQFVSMDQYKHNEHESIDDRNEEDNYRCDETDDAENEGTKMKNDGERDQEIEVNELEISTSELLPISYYIETNDFNVDTSFSEYMDQNLSRKENILQRGNTITNVNFLPNNDMTTGEYFDLSTQTVNVVTRDTVESYAMSECRGSNERCDDNMIKQTDSEQSKNSERRSENELNVMLEDNQQMETVDQRKQHGHPLTSSLGSPQDEAENIEPVIDARIQSTEPSEEVEEDISESENDTTSLECSQSTESMSEKVNDIEPVVDQGSQSTKPSEELEENNLVGTDDVEAAMEEIHKEHGTKPKRKANKEAWEKEINKKKRAKGEEYMGRKYTSKKEFTTEKKSAKLLDDRCECKTSYTECNTVSEEDRQKTFEHVWKLEWAEKKHFVSAMTYKKEVSKKTTQSASRRSDTLVYMLKKVDGQRVRVCKKMFLATTGLTDYFVRTYAEVQEANARENGTKSSTKTKSVLYFLHSLPVQPSHYCRHDTSKLYLESTFGTTENLFRVYKEYCTTNQLESAGKTTFKHEIDKQNYAIFKPRKDQCDDCTEYAVGNRTEEEHGLHILDKNTSRNEMEADVRRAKELNGSLKVITMDLQRVLLCPSLNVSALYYRTKLCVHNFSIFDCVSADARCYVWHEAEAGLSANEFATCLHNYLTDDLNWEKCIIWSDGCTYQNRNVVMSKALTNVAQRCEKTIEQKILTKGHTQMRVDSIHSTIETAIGNKPIMCPADYIRIMEDARRTPKPYEVHYLDHTFFKNFSSTCTFKSIRPGSRAGDPVVVDIKALHYDPTGEILYKLKFSDEWKPLPIKRGESTKIEKDPVSLHANQIPIAASKFQHLQELKRYIRADYHAFYDALPHV